MHRKPAQELFCEARRRKFIPRMPMSISEDRRLFFWQTLELRARPQLIASIRFSSASLLVIANTLRAAIKKFSLKSLARVARARVQYD